MSGALKRIWTGILEGFLEPDESHDALTSTLRGHFCHSKILPNKHDELYTDSKFIIEFIEKTCLDYSCHLWMGDASAENNDGFASLCILSPMLLSNNFQVSEQSFVAQTKAQSERIEELCQQLDKARQNGEEAVKAAEAGQ